ncbi:MAG: ABC transporter ATP-binding protein [Firmicutes bacterium]|nr:ABC transporter ATP-binding protein [Bacillota bacterium]
MIKVNDLSFAYDDKNEVLKNISLNIDSQKVTAILGHNGAGKTTLFKCITGLLKPQSGSIEIKLNSNEESCLEKYISYMPDTGGLYPLLSPMENLIFRASFYQNNNEAKESAMYWLDKARLNKSVVRFSGNLSHGIQKRLSFACALINSPKIILLDEPTNGLDPESIDIISNIINEKNKQDTTILINTHDLNLVREVCDKVFFLQNGKVIGENKVSEIEKNLKEYYLKKVGAFNG